MENIVDRKGWQPAIHGVAQSQGHLKKLSSRYSEQKYTEYTPEYLPGESQTEEASELWSIILQLDMTEAT